MELVSALCERSPQFAHPEELEHRNDTTRIEDVFIARDRLQARGMRSVLIVCGEAGLGDVSVVKQSVEQMLRVCLMQWFTRTQ